MVRKAGCSTRKAAPLFGYTDLYGGYMGGQAEYVPCLTLTSVLAKCPTASATRKFSFLTDIFPTDFSGVEWAGVKGGETVAVFGCGPVGLMAQKCAWVRDAKHVIGLDIEPYRLEMASRSAKSETVNVKECDAVEVIRSLTEGRGADVCIDAVGMEAERSLLGKAKNVLHMEIGTINVLKMCLSAVHREGAVSISGVYGRPYDNFPIGQIFDKGLSIYTGQALVHRCIDELISWLEDGRIRLDDIITHPLPLAEAPHGYKIFNEEKENCVKVVLSP